MRLPYQHYAFLVGEEEFDAAFGRIRDQGLANLATSSLTARGIVAINNCSYSPANRRCSPDLNIVKASTVPVDVTPARNASTVTPAFPMASPSPVNPAA